MEQETLDIRYYGETHCKLSCKNCYLGFSDPGYNTPFFKRENYKNIILSHYLNIQSIAEKTIDLYFKDIDYIINNFFNNSDQNYYYTLITDLSTYLQLKENPLFIKSLEALPNYTFSLSFKKTNDVLKLKEDKIFNLPNLYSFSFIHGIDNKNWYKIIEGHAKRSSNKINLMFNKPITFDIPVLHSLVNYQKQNINHLIIDDCIKKLIYGYDCTKKHQDPQFIDSEVNIQNKKFHRCAYTKDSCIISLDNENFPKIKIEDISYILD